MDDKDSEDETLIYKFNPDLYWCIVGSKMKWKNNLSMGEEMSMGEEKCIININQK